MDILTKYIAIKNAADAGDFVETLTTAEKIELRTKLEQLKVPVVRSLYYDYNEQKWI